MNIENFEILALSGQGGFHVREAAKSSFGRLLAVKLLSHA
jgi:hypothetical protein